MGRVAGMLGRVPLVRRALRRWAHRWTDGATVKIRWGAGRGLWWRRLPGYGVTTFLGLHEPAVQRALPRLVRPGDVIYDVGAHLGFFSLVAARLAGPTGQVYSFEPHPGNAALIRELAALNRLENVNVVESAVADVVGELAFAVGDRPNRSRLAVADGRVTPDSSVRVTTLDAFVQGHPRPQVIKLDAERAEALVLAGAATVLRGPAPPTLLMELHTGELAESCRALLTEHGYSLTTLAGQPANVGKLAKGHYLAQPRRAPGGAT